MNPPAVNRPTDKDAVFACKTCGYRISDVLMNSARFDYGCPGEWPKGQKCGNSFGNFELLKDTEERAL